jgi:hypothetical protein
MEKVSLRLTKPMPKIRSRGLLNVTVNFCYSRMQMCLRLNVELVTFSDSGTEHSSDIQNDKHNFTPSELRSLFIATA